MNKTAIKNYAISARVQLIEAVRQKAFEYEVTETGENKPDLDAINGRVLTAAEREQRNQLIEQIRQKGYAQVMEEAAYTWFNRFIALRFMEVNGYLPSKTRVFTDENNAFKPEILKQAMTVELDGLDRERVFDLLDKQNNEELYKYLLLTQCNALNAALPDMFETIGSWTELLFPANLLKADSVIERMVKEIPESDWTDQVEIIGWLYQFYNDERKNQVINIQKSIVKKEDIPAATQLFTTDWVVRYIVDNSLGRYWIERNPESNLAEKLDYFVMPKNGQITHIDEKIDPQEIKFLDPCMGSAHFLVYAFDVLMAIYIECGYSERDAAILIAEKNLYGLEIDQRAFQLAYFALMMKVRSFNRKVLRKDNKVDLNITYIRPTDYNTDFVSLYSEITGSSVVKILNEFKTGDELGSIIRLSVTPEELSNIYAETTDILNSYYDNIFDTTRQSMIRTHFLPVLKQAKILIEKFDIVATNPPFMNKMDKDLKNYVNDKYKDYSGDLFSVFIYRNFDFCKPNGYSGFMSPYVWMFIKTYEKLRNYILSDKSITTLIQMEYSAFEEATVPICTFVLKNARSTDKGLYFRLTEFKGGMQVQKEKVLEAISDPECGYFYEADSDNFSKIPGSPIAYWVSDSIINAYKNDKVGQHLNCRSGIMTGNDKYIKIWFEVLLSKIRFDCKTYLDMGEYKWFPLNSGGDYRKWYGNNSKIVNLWHDGAEIKANVKNYRLREKELYFRKGITWGRISSSKIAFRDVTVGSLFGDAGPIGFVEKNKNYILGFLSTNVSLFFLQITNPTLNYQVRDIENVPLILPHEQGEINKVESLVEKNISYAKYDWDSFETSWDFKEHPFVWFSKGLWDCTNVAASLHHYYGDQVKPACPIETCWLLWQAECDDRFNRLKANEEELNRIFIEIYGLQNELTPEVDDKDVTVRKADLQRDMRSFVSYAVGCMFGRYSVNEEGLQFAGGSFSDEWVVVSGQYFSRKVVEYYVSQELSRVDRLAEIYGFSDRDLSTGEAAPEGGNVWLIRPDEEGGGVDPFQYRRGTSKKLYEGIHPVSFHSKGIEIGAGNTAFDLCSPEILDAITNRNGDELIKRGWQDAERVDWETIHYSLTTNHLSPDLDNIIPICDDEYFDDDIVGLFVDFVRKVYGEETLEENLRFVADALGGKGTPREIIRRYFLNDFYKDHCKIYQKRPIYWLFSSGKKNGFKALIYLHRYQPDLLARIRTDYVHEQQERYRTQLKMLEDAFEKAAASERVKLNKQIQKLKEQSLEIRQYEEKIHHLADRMIPLDLDDGVKVNYEKFAGVVEKIK